MFLKQVTALRLWLWLPDQIVVSGIGKLGGNRDGQEGLVHLGPLHFNVSYFLLIDDNMYMLENEI